MLRNILERDVKVWAILFVAIVVTASFKLRVDIPSGQAWRFLVDVATLLGPLAIWLAYNHYRSTKRDQRMQILILLQQQSLNIAEWISGREGEYEGWSDDEVNLASSLLTWSAPFYDIKHPHQGALPAYLLAPGVVDLSRDLTQYVSRLNQNVTDFTDFVGLIRQFKYSAGADRLVEISAKRREVIEGNPCTSGENEESYARRVLENLKAELSEPYDRFLGELLKMYQHLHSQLVGSASNTQSLYWNLNEVLRLVDKELANEGYVRNDSSTLNILRSKWLAASGESR